MGVQSERSERISEEVFIKCIIRLQSLKTNSKEEETIKEDLIRKLKNLNYIIEIKFLPNNLDFVEKIESLLSGMIRTFIIGVGGVLRTFFRSHFHPRSIAKIVADVII
jgi:hypothetical protein